MSHLIGHPAGQGRGGGWCAEGALENPAAKRPEILRVLSHLIGVSLKWSLSQKYGGVSLNWSDQLSATLLYGRDAGRAAHT